MTATTRTGLALLVAALVLGVCSCQDDDRSSRPRRTDLADVRPTLTPPLGPGAAMVARVLVETRGGVRP